MKLAIIDIQSQTYKYLKATQSSLGDFIHLKCKDSEDLSAIAKKVNDGNFDIILINIECKYERANRSDVKGIELIYWLRLKENYIGTIITYGFLSAAQILRLKPEYVVLHAPGNYHLRLPDPDELGGIESIVKSNVNLKKDTITETYRPFANKLISIQAARHENANWWAIKTMWDIENIRKKENKGFPKFITNKLNELNSFLISEIYSSEDIIRIDDIVSVITNKYEENIQIINEKKKELRKKRKEFEKIKNNNIELIKDEILTNQEFIQLLLDEVKENENYISELKKYDQAENHISNPYTDKIEELKNDIENVKEKNIKLKNHIKEINSSQLNVEQEVVEENVFDKTLDVSLENELQNKIENLDTNVSDKVLLIDDMAGQGWLELYQRIFPSIEFYSIDFNEFKESYKENLDKLKTKIAKEVIANNISFIILDLRLFPEDNTIITHKYSGFEILDYLKQTFVSLPIIVTSASNKIWTLKKCLDKGADNYWMKEGFDNFFSKKDSIYNYVEFINSINAFYNADYTIIKKIRGLRLGIEQKRKYWWQNHNWNATYFTDNIRIPKKAKFIITVPDSYKETKLDKDIIINILKEVESIMVQYIRNYSIFKSNITIDPYNQVIETLSKVLEKIHPYSKVDNISISVGNIIKSRGDFRGSKIYYNRNQSLHQNHFHTTDELTTFIEFISKYLTYNVSIDNKFNLQQKSLEEEFSRRNKDIQIIREYKEKTKTISKEVLKKVENVKLVKKEFTKKEEPVGTLSKTPKIVLETIINKKEEIVDDVDVTVVKDERQQIKEKDQSLFIKIVNWFKNIFH